MQCHQLYIRHQLWKMFNGLHHIVQFLQAVTCTTGSTYSYVYRTAADTTCHMISIHKCCSVEAEHWICVCKFNANSNIKFICLCVCATYVLVITNATICKQHHMCLCNFCYFMNTVTWSWQHSNSSSKHKLRAVCTIECLED